MSAGSFLHLSWGPKGSARKSLAIFVMTTLVMVSLGCGLSTARPGSSNPPPVAITIAPSSASVTVGKQQQFTTTVTGTSNTAVTWQVNGVAGGNTTTGTVSSTGLYTAPSSVPSGQVTVTAVSQADASKTASAAVTVTLHSPIANPLGTPLVDLTNNNYEPSYNSSGVLCNGSNGCNAALFEGGLYASGSNSPAPAQDTDARNFASAIQTLEARQQAVMICIGMSIMKQNCDQLVSDYNASSLTRKDPELHFFDMAQSGYDACLWAYWNPVDGPGATPTVPSSCPLGTYPNPPYNDVNTVYLPAVQTCGTSHTTKCGPADVRAVIWQDADAGPTNGLPCTAADTPADTYFKDFLTNSYVPCSGLADAYQLEKFIGMTARSVKYNYPNVSLMFVVSRNYAGYSKEALNPEPYAYEAGFANQFIVKAQNVQCPGSGTCITTPGDSYAGDLSYVATPGNACGGNPCAPLIIWIGYTWANGATPRALDGLIWCDASFTSGQSGPPCSDEEDFESAGDVHASPDGSKKWSSATQSVPGTSGTWTGILNQLLTSPYASPFFHQ